MPVSYTHLDVYKRQVSKKKDKYVYPLLVSVLFIPSVFIYYNDSALIHSIWYLLISSVGLLIGALMQYFFSRKLNKSEVGGYTHENCNH